jgi:NTE family protein
MDSDTRKADSKPTYVLVLQGGGALGAYHIGAYQALAERELLPDWVCGISIGAINAAVIAGNAPEQRLARLDALWEHISWPSFFGPFGSRTLATLYNTGSNAEALLFGQPNFFAPRPVNPFFAPPGPQALSFYDTTPLRFTLRRFADFERINAGETRLSLGATDALSGTLEFFDSQRAALTPEHVMASGSLPPGFPPTAIGDRLYWDGGCVSNTPLEAVLQDQPAGHTIVFMIDLWSADGPAPRTMNDVLWREKQIQYASRTESHIDAVAAKVNLRHAMKMLSHGEGEPPAASLDIVHIVYHPAADQIPNSDAEFSRSSIRERRAAGYADMKTALDAAPWLRQEKAPSVGCLVHRVADQAVSTLPPLAPPAPAGTVEAAPAAAPAARPSGRRRASAASPG